MPERIISIGSTSNYRPENYIQLSVNISENDPLNKKLDALAESLFDNASEPKAGQKQEVIEFTTPSGITGTITSSGPLNSKQEELLNNTGFSYKRAGGVSSPNQEATNELFKVLTQSRAEQGDLSDVQRIEAISLYQTLSHLVKHEILPSGADPNAIEEKTGKLPLQFALEREAKLGFMEGVKSSSSVIPALLKHGADPHKKNENGESPMDTAKRLGMDDAVQLFKEHAKDRHSSVEQSTLQNALAQAGAEISSLNELKDYQMNPPGNSTEIGRAAQQGGKGKPGSRTLTA